ncbi:MAG: hypothetical protein RR425_04955, partial [Erysipelotrichales bacterium]
KNHSVKEYSLVKKDINNKKVFASLSKYKNNKKYKYVKYEYKKGVFNKRFEYIFNNKYQLRENKNSKAIRYTTYYKKNKAYKTYKNYYNKKGKLIIKNYYAKLRVGLK